MSILGKLKIKKDEESSEVSPETSAVVSADKKVQSPVKAEKKVKKVTKTQEIKGKTDRAYRILIKPMITEKASGLGGLNKYVFAVEPSTNKVEVKKAIRAVYNVDPIAVNILNFSGKRVRYGKTSGVTKGWKKAVVTLKPGDKIEVYEGI
ncbi:MAG: 50S ribosomal protein L23 [Candidatus Buchananbacteria bacterium]|nr:50S ribosomal protein L23 [Candidatus Buchananbacteria bacterium]